MNELILSFLIIAFAFTGLAVGLIFKNQPIKGSVEEWLILRMVLLVKYAEVLIQKIVKISSFYNHG